MKRNVLFIDLFREIWQSKNRFLSILAIIALGTGFFAGIKVTTPDMKFTADAYYHKQKLSDFHLVSTMGLTQEDVDSIKNMKEVAAVMPGYSADLMVRINQGDEIIAKIISLPINRLSSDPTYLNQPVLLSGKMPYQRNECLLDNNMKGNIGDTITFVSDGSTSDLSDILHTTTCKVVGKVNSPRYISFDRGYTSIGNGIIRGYVYVPEEDFSYEVFTDIYISLHFQGLSSFSQEYQDLIDEVSKKLETIGDRQELLRYDEVYQDALKEINKGEQEYLDEKTKANQELRNAWNDLQSGQTKIADAKNELSEEVAKARQDIETARQELIEGEETYQKEYADFLVKIAEGQKKIDDGRVELEKGENKLLNGKDELAQGRREFNEQKSAAMAELTQAQATVDSLSGLTQIMDNYQYATDEQKGIVMGTATQLQTSTQPAEQQLGNALQSFINDPSDVNKETAKQTLMYFVQGAQAQINAGKAALQTGEAKLDEAAREINAGQRELNQARMDLLEAQQTLLEEQAKALSEFQDARIELDDGYAKLEEAEINLAKEIASAEADIDEGSSELNSGLRDYNKAKKDALKEFAKAELEIEDAKKELAKLEYPKWYVFDRTKQPGYGSYEEDAQRVDKIAGVFPIFFILIAALICLSTMSRMVEEQRTQIGTWKALGYSRYTIALKYILYAILASIIGSAIGLTLGLKLFPLVIFDAFRIMYILPDIVTQMPLDMILVSLIVAMLCTTVSAALACRHELLQAPSQLMRPKPPKHGKRVLLERVGWIWNRLSFNAKITIRNLMRYKGRVLMTMIGIGGCTALMLTGFGLQYSISSIVDKQYGNVFHYDVLGALDENLTSREMEEVNSIINQSRYVADSMTVYQMTYEASNNEKSYSAYLFVPQDANRINEFISFQSRIDQQPKSLSHDGVVITEKLARLLNIEVGDSFTLEDNEVQVRVSVASIVENYTFHYVYMTSTMYESLFHRKFSPNMLIANLVEDGERSEKAFASELLKHDAILGVSFSRESGQKFANLIGALNVIVVVIIVCAGALAFVVLYNLTNINVNERLRELATIKVLGFYDTEVSAYIYRENSISAFLGMLAGLIMGIWLHQFVIVNAEVEMVMFTPSIDSLSFWYAGLLTIMFTAIVNIALHFRLRHIDMVESLKSVE